MKPYKALNIRNLIETVGFRTKNPHGFDPPEVFVGFPMARTGIFSGWE
jgi:hypothetical protein